VSGPGEIYAMTGLSTWRWEPAADRLVFSGEREETRAALGLPQTLEGTLRMVQPSHRSEVRRVVTRAAEGVDDSYCIRYPSTVVAGRERWLESRGVVVRGAGGQVEAVQGTTQDVTEAELARLELLRSRNFNQATIDSLDAHVAVLDEEGTIVLVNGAWARFASRNGSPGVGVGASYPGVCDAAGNTAQEACLVAQALRQMLAGSLSWYEVEYPCHSPDAERWFKMQATVHRGDGAARVVVQHHDITRRVLLERDERLRSRLLDEVDAAVIATDLDGRVTLWSRGAQALYAWTDEEAVGEPLADLTVPSQGMTGWTASLSMCAKTPDGRATSSSGERTKAAS